MELLVKKKEIVNVFLRNKVLISREILSRLESPGLVDEWHSALSKGVNPADLLCEKKSCDVKVLWDYDDKPKKRSVQDFVDYFNARYRAIEKLLQSRQELQNLTSISRLKGKKEREAVSVIGMVFDKWTTKNEHLMVTLEDSSGTINVLFSKSKADLFSSASDVVFDEVIGVRGTLGDGIVFADTLIVPDVPIREMKKAPDEVYVAVLSCVHVGSKLFESEKFNNFVEWTNGRWGSDEDKRVASRLKYVFICGDLVDGVGIYPGQEKELSITDIREQYVECARLLKGLRSDLNIILAPGNHDVGRISEPQPKFSKLYAGALWDLPNVTVVCNPCYLCIHQSGDFAGFDVLMYHGYSFDDYGEVVPSIKHSGKHASDRGPLVMRYLLQRRHLAPQHTSTLYIPDNRYDPLVIEHVPDLFFAGHLHKSGYLNYRGTTLVSASCFQSKTSFQEKMGHDPDPGAVPVVNLQTREILLMRF